ncbi:LlsX family protein [Clostridium sp.]|uniref:LlsX family protein n=1 Tax=Clostridium sp. TaxID=1506 RepID=UPI003216E89B
MNNNQLKRIIIFIVIGILISVAFCTIFITLGYFDAYKNLPERQAIDILGMPIYILEKTGEKYAGTPVNSNMSFIGIIFSILTVIIGEFIYFRKHKKAVK